MRAWTIGVTVRTGAAAIALLITACASSASTTTTGTPPPAPVTDTDSVSEYLVTMVNLTAEQNEGGGVFEDEYRRQWCLDMFGVEECANRETTEAEMFQYQRGLLVGTMDILLSSADTISAVTPPPSFIDLHQAYVATGRAYATAVRDRFAATTTIEELEAILLPLLDPLGQLPPDLAELLTNFVSACAALEQAGSDAGFRVDLSCPLPPPEVVLVDVVVGGSWRAEPNPLPVGDGVVTIMVTNNGSQPVSLVIVEILEGDPLHLPEAGGLVDLRRSSEFGGVDTSFRLIVPDEEQFLFGDLTAPPTLAPGESMTITNWWISGPLVIFNHRADVFDTAEHLVVDRVD